MEKIFYTIVLIFCFACSSSDSKEGGNNDGDQIGNSPPSPSAYITPSNNETCTGNIISNTEIEVSFQWQAFQDVEDSFLTYQFSVINQATNTEIINEILAGTSISVILEKGVTYSWNVTATDGDGASTTGAIWQFQTPFDAASNYAPFPATLLTPNNGEVLTNTNVVLIWEGNDPDSGETSQLVYDVYLGDSNPPVIVATNISTLDYSEILSIGTYFWKIVSRDPNGNSSESQVRQFIVQ